MFVFFEHLDLSYKELWEVSSNLLGQPIKLMYLVIFKISNKDQFLSNSDGLKSKMSIIESHIYATYLLRGINMNESIQM